MEKMRPALSPTKAAFGNRVPKQIQRCLPLYITAIVFFLLMANLDLLGSASSIGNSKRGVTPDQKPLLAPAGGNNIIINNINNNNNNNKSAIPIPETFPRKVWQTWKVDALAFEERDLGRARTWTAKNPGYRYEVLTDNNDMYYVEAHFGLHGINRPDIVDVYRSLTARIIKADLLRYLIMYVEGGVYADIDVENLKPIDRWLPRRFEERDVDIVIGVEVDEPTFAQHPILGQKSRSFCQWTFMCKPGNPFMLRLIDGILEWLHGVALKEGKGVGDIVLDFDEVLTGTGPSAFTAAALAEMSAREGREVTWDTFHNLDEAVLVKGMLVLNVEAFAAGQGHSDSGNHHSRFALVKHRYHASAWTDAHPRHMHPAYGEVEKCNWNAECVAMWDVNTAAYEKLSEEDQAKLIAIKKFTDEADRVKAEQEARFLDALEKQEAQKPVFDPGPQLEALSADPARAPVAGGAGAGVLDAAAPATAANAGLISLPLQAAAADAAKFLPAAEFPAAKVPVADDKTAKDASADGKSEAAAAGKSGEKDETTKDEPILGAGFGAS
ncbi:hypothetical protein JHW43_003851 [Diplocarpon mali]|nr:hypothetical protein JHW43_003851 [Diplocarpon mali]